VSRSLPFGSSETIVAENADLVVYAICGGPRSLTLGIRAPSTFSLMGTHYFANPPTLDSRPIYIVSAGALPFTGQTASGFDGFVTARGSGATYHVSAAIHSNGGGCDVLGQVTY
jgi:hypothetical protein